MSKDYRSMLPSGDSQQRGGDAGGRQGGPRQQEKPDVILPVSNSTGSREPDNRQAAAFYDPKEYERRVKVVVEGKMLEGVVRDAIGLLTEQVGLLNDIPLDAMRNNSNKLVNQDMDIQPLEDMNRKAGETLRSVVRCIHDSRFMGIYLEELTRGDRERWQLSEKDKVALFALPVLAYYTGKYHLSDTMIFLWLVAGMPLLAITTIWGVNEVVGWIARRKAKPRR